MIVTRKISGHIDDVTALIAILKIQTKQRGVEVELPMRKRAINRRRRTIRARQKKELTAAIKKMNAAKAEDKERLRGEAEALSMKYFGECLKKRTRTVNKVDKSEHGERIRRLEAARARGDEAEYHRLGVEFGFWEASV